MKRRSFLQSLATLTAAAVVGCGSSESPFVMSPPTTSPQLVPIGRLEDSLILRFDNAGGEYQIDSFAGTVRKVSGDGTVIWTFQDLDGFGESAYPVDLATDPDGRVFLLDRAGEGIKVLDENGQLQGSIGQNDLALSFPNGLAVAGDELYVSDAISDQVSVFSIPGGLLLRQFGGFGTDPGKLNSPRTVAVASTGDIYVLDAGNLRMNIYQATGDFKFSFPLLDPGLDDDEFNAYSFALGVGDRSYVADQVGSSIVVFDAQGDSLGSVPLVSENGTKLQPSHVAIDPTTGLLYITYNEVTA